MDRKASLLAWALFAATLCGCTASRQATSKDVLNACLLDSDQPGWVYLAQPPANIDALRTAMVTFNPVSRFDLKYTEYWFSHADGQIMRCTLHPQFGPGVCGAFNYVFSLHDGSWTAKHGPLIMCHERLK